METVTRNFKVKGTLKGLYSPNGDAPEDKYIPNMEVQLWYKGPMETVYLGQGLTESDGAFTVEFKVQSPSSMVVNGKINDVFIKVVYNGKTIIGDMDSSGGSFD